MQKKSFNTPDEIKTLPKTKLEIVKLGGSTFTRTTFEPGWKWSEHVGPATGTKSCQTYHLLSMISGQLKVVMDDGTMIELKPGEVGDIPPGHDAWVIGDIPAVGIETGGNI